MVSGHKLFMQAWVSSFFPPPFFKCLFIFERERETACARVEGQRQRVRQRIPSRLHAVSTEPDAGLEPMNHEIMTWGEIKSQTLNQLSHPGTPLPSLLMFIYLFLRQRDRECAGEGQRERETQNMKRAPGSGLLAQSPMRGSYPWTVRSWPEPKPRVGRWTNWATQEPPFLLLESLQPKWLRRMNSQLKRVFTP